jgi:hypothetical protein
VPTNPSREEYLPLLKTQRNAVFDWVREAGFDPSDFEVDAADWGGARCTRFAYRGSPYYFDVSMARSAYSLRWTPGDSEALGHVIDYTVVFELIEPPFKAWLTYLRRELEAPDLWGLLGEKDPALPPFGSSGNTPFTEAELGQVIVQIDAARTYFIEAGATGEALAVVNERLEYLVAAAKRSGRMDWMNIAFSVLFGLAGQLNFDPNQARELIQLVVTFVERLQLP